MTLTRFSGTLYQKRASFNFYTIYSGYFTRHISTASSQTHSTPSGSEKPSPKTARTRKSQTVTKLNYDDLPSAYMTPSGEPATPLKDWFSSYHTAERLIANPTTTEQRIRKSRKREGTEEGISAENEQNEALLSKNGDTDTDTLSKKLRKSRKRKLEEATGETEEVADDTPMIDPAQRSHTKKAVADDGPPIPKKKPDVLAKLSKIPKPNTFLSAQILSNLKRFPHCLLLTRVGNFYESYFDQAVDISNLLNIKLTSRKWNGERVAMCGFPLAHLDKYLKVLVQEEKRFVALCEEFPVYSDNNVKEFERRIARVVTPGTLIDESFLNPLENNYLLAISPGGEVDEVAQKVGLAWIDVSTGEFFSKQSKLENVPDELARIAPREVVLDDSFQGQPGHAIFETFADSNCLISYAPVPPRGTVSDPESNIDDEPALDTVLTQESIAIELLTEFLRQNLLDHMPRLDSPLREISQDRMQIDLHTIQGLEIRGNSAYEGGSKGSLLSVIKRTNTSGGTRLLARWLCSPSTSITEIHARQELVSFFRERTHFRMDVVNVLKDADDLGRLCQKFLLGRADFSDLVGIRAAINLWDRLGAMIELEKEMEIRDNRFRAEDWNAIDAMYLRTTNLKHLSEKISSAVTDNLDDLTEGPEIDASPSNGLEDPDTPLTEVDKVVSKKWSINHNFSAKLKALDDGLQQLLEEKETLEQNLREQYNAPSLTLRSASSQGMFLHISRAKRDRKKLDLDPEFYSIGETQTTKSYIYRRWSQLGSKIGEQTLALSLAEKAVFDELSLEVIEHAHKLRQNAQVIDELDVLLSFAVLAEDMNFVRPEIKEDGSYSMTNGRHPSVEMGLLSSGRQFTPNSVDLNPTSNIHIITGPNMAGKSTLLRQTAIVAILAQIGCCVPADHAHISIVDKLFSRIGAKDDLFRDRSTFMVEMLETADILRRATDKSLVIMDEVGRGTTVRDGLAIAFATLHHIATVNKSRCLFATHFHELSDMVGNVGNTHGTGVFKNVRFYCSDVDDAGDGHFAYSYKLRPGINRDSHGLKVARLAGLPPAAMDIASQTLSWLREKGTSNIQQNYDNFLKCTLHPTP